MISYAGLGFGRVLLCKYGCCWHVRKDENDLS